MRTLLDTCVLSELQRAECAESVRQAVAAIADQELFLSVITIGEITKGIALLNEGKRKQRLYGWLSTLEQDYQDRILDVTREVVSLWGNISAEAQKQGRIIPVADGLIGATAKHHGLQLITRNVDDFAAIGLTIINPWRSL